MGAQRVKYLPRVLPLISGSGGIWTQAVKALQSIISTTALLQHYLPIELMLQIDSQDKPSALQKHTGQWNNLNQSKHQNVPKDTGNVLFLDHGSCYKDMHTL